MFSFLSKLFGFSTKGYNFRKIEKKLGPWQCDGQRLCLSGSKLPKYFILPDFVTAFNDQPGEHSLSSILFPYWLRVEPSLAGFALKMVNEGKFYYVTEMTKKDGSKRQICSPDKVLKFIQRRILERILEQIDIHDAAHGFVKGRSIITAAEPHCRKQVVVTMDIEDFFGTITYKRVVGLFKRFFPKEVARKLAGLCCFQGKLPQGAPTSPMISNIICWKMDTRISGLAKKYNFSYTRYADDIIISGDESILKSISFIEKIINAEGFQLAKHKTKIKRSGSRQQILGLTVNSKVSVPRKVRRLIRAMIHKQYVEKRSDTFFIFMLKGHTAFMKPLHPEEAYKNYQKLKELC